MPLHLQAGLRGLKRGLSLWELIEGGCSVLTTRFAQFVGHVLIQARSSTGVSALYVPHMAITTNAWQARAALEGLLHAAALYTTAVGWPSFDGTEGSRAQAVAAGSAITAEAVGRSLNTNVLKRRTLHADVSPWGWAGVGGRRH